MPSTTLVEMVSLGRDRESFANGSGEFEDYRQFQFNIENDENLQSIINPLLMSASESQAIGESSLHYAPEFTSHHILSKLYNYMKISEMSKYGISVFEKTFSSYLPYLTESDLITLATSYWCNGQHFTCIISHRGHPIRSGLSTLDERIEVKLTLRITEDLLDSTMSSGASVDKIEAMLLQKRIDEGVKNIPKKLKSSFQHTKCERNFYLRNLTSRFWNHEVLAQVFIQNGWLTPKLAQHALDAFVESVYHRILRSKLGFVKIKGFGRMTDIDIRTECETYLRSFFASHFCVNDIPKRYRDRVQRMGGRSSDYDEFYIFQMRPEILQRWCALVESLASRGAKINDSQFAKLLPLQYALRLGKNTYDLICLSYENKNRRLIPHSYQQEHIQLPNDIWDTLISYL